MITRISIENFKKLEKVEFNLSQSVVLIGPNNSGKSTIFQALCLWEIGVVKVIETGKKVLSSENEYVTVNRKDLLNSPIEDALWLWRNKQVDDSSVRSHESDADDLDGRIDQISRFFENNIKIVIKLAGERDGKSWVGRTEFFYLNPESIGCRVEGDLDLLAQLYTTGKGVRFSFLQPMSGIATDEDLLTIGAINRRLGEGRTAEVLRNICYSIINPETRLQAANGGKVNWVKLTDAIRQLFGVSLREPEFFRASGRIQLEYEENGIRYDISAAGRGLQQTLLLLAYMYANPGATLLLDEPDAHLEVIRQREIFQLINSVANETNSQLIIASHSEVVLDEAAEASNIIAVIDSQAIELNPSSNRKQVNYLKKSLTEIGWERYYLARLKKHILYVEGSTDLEMLKKLASQLQHPAEVFLQKANVQYTATNVPHKAVENFVALREFMPELRGFALFDKIEGNQEHPRPIPVHFWQRRELENYFAKPQVLLRHAALLHTKHPEFSSDSFKEVMQEVIAENTVPAALKDLNHKFWNDTKLSDDWLDVIFPEFYNRLGLPQDFYKRDYYTLIGLLQPDEIDPEITEKLDAILAALQ